MLNLTSVTLDGNITADPESKQTASGKAVVNFRVAANHEYGGKEGKKQVSYFPVECWDGLAENCAKYLTKGSHVTVQGELREDRWQDADGKNKSRLKIVARFVRFDYTPNREKNESENPETGTDSRAKKSVKQKVAQPSPSVGNEAANRLEQSLGRFYFASS